MNNEPLFFKTLLLKGEAGGTIERIVKTETVGLTDIYTIYINDGSTQEIEVTNGSSIASIEYTSSSGNVDTYTVTLTDGSTTTFNVTNGEDYTVPTDGVIFYDGSDTPDGYEDVNPPAGQGCEIDDANVSLSTTYSSSKIEQLISGIGGGGVDYSTSEQDTGLKWVDGKPIYQRTFTRSVNSIATGWQVTYVDWGDMVGTKVLKSEVIYERYNRVYSGFLMQFYFDDSSPSLYSPFALNESGTLYVTVWYTKTTD